MAGATAADRVEGRFRSDPFAFEGGATTAAVEIAYWTLGRADPGGGRTLLLCHGASGDRDWALPFCRPGGAFDPERWLIVSVDLPGGGASSRPRDGAGFPADYTIGDLAGLVERLLAHLSLERVGAFCGPSMAGLVGTELARRRPGLIGAMALWTAGPRSDGYAAAVAEAIALILRGEGSRDRRFRAAAAAFLPALLGRPALERMGAAGRGAMADDMAARWSAAWEPEELAARYAAIGRYDPAEPAAPHHPPCPTLWLQASTDQLFDLSALQALAAHLPGARVRSVASPMGHLATAGPAGSPEFDFFDRETAAFLLEHLS